MPFSTEDNATIHVFTCNCLHAIQQHERLNHIDNNIVEDVSTFLSREQQNYCIHAYAANIIISDNALFPTNDIDEVEHDDDVNDDDNDDDACVEQLETNPLLAAVFDGCSYGIVGTEQYNRKRRLVCKSCSMTRAGSVTRCSHVDVYRGWCRTEGLELEYIVETDDQHIDPSFSCISHIKIPYPLPERLKVKHDRLNAGLLPFPANLVPEVPADSPHCEHGNLWDTRDPMKEQWIQKSGAVIYRSNTVITSTSNGSDIVVYYRPTEDRSCTCRLMYDGLDDLLFNLNNRELFYIGFLYEYMHSMIEGI